jgi:hypothetical protein
MECLERGAVAELGLGALVLEALLAAVVAVVAAVERVVQLRTLGQFHLRSRLGQFLQ